MAQRRESVLLELQDSYTSEMVKAAAATALLKRELKDLSGTSVQTSRASATISRDVDKVSRSARDADDSINQLTGRIRVLADVAAILGPSLVPIGAAAIPAVTGLANQLGIAAGAAGVAVVAFQGVGDALKAMNEYQLAPTTENLGKLNDAMAMLSPSGQSLTQRLGELTASLRGLSHEAQGDMFPGLVDALDALDALGPQTSQIVSNIATALGDIARSSGEGLAGDRWSSFFDMLERDARPTLATLASTIGDLTLGLANMQVAFQPLNLEFGDWLEGVAADFAAWSAGLGGNDSFIAFMDYIRTTGPQVGETLGDLGSAIVRIVEAVAPLGGPSLMILESFADVVELIAGSNLGTPLFALATTMAVLSRATSAWGAVAGSTFGKFVGDTGRASMGVRTLTTDLRLMSAEYGRLGRVQSVALSALSGTTAAAQRTTKTLSGLGSAALPIAGVGLAASGMADDMAYANTITMGLMGTMAGPWGAAVGAGVGLLMDFAGSQQNASRDTSGLTASLDQQTGALTENSAAWVANELGADRLRMLEDLGLSTQQVTAALLEGGPALAGIMDQLDRAAQSDGVFLDQTAQEASWLSLALQSLRGDIEQTTDDFATIKAAADGGVFTGFIGGATEGMKAAEGFSAALRDNVDAIREQYEAAQQASNANLAYSQALLDSKEGVKEYGAVLRGTRLNQVNLTEDQIKARRIINDQAGAWNNLSEQAQNAPGAFKAARKALIDTATDMGYTEGQAKRLANQILEIPEKRATKIALEGEEEAKRKAADIGAAIDWAARPRTVMIGVAGNLGALSIGTRSADGGFVPKTGLPYADRHPYLLADGEGVTTNRSGETDRFRDVIEGINAGLSRSQVKGMLADGGFAGSPGSPTTRPFGMPDAVAAMSSAFAFGDALRYAGMSVKELERELKSTEKALTKAEEAQDRQQSVVDALTSTMESLSDAIQQKLLQPLFSDARWTDGMDPTVERQTLMAQLRNSGLPSGWTSEMLEGTDLQTLRDLTRPNALEQAMSSLQGSASSGLWLQQMIASLSDKGLKGAALDDLIRQSSLSQLADFANASAGEIQAYAAQWEQTQAIVGATGQAGANAAYGAELKQQTRIFNRMSSRVDELTNEVKDLKQAMENRVPRKIGAEVGDAVGDKLNGVGAKVMKGKGH